jgi:peptidoglycan/LPS O-acetylase OafA/YrhL
MLQRLEKVLRQWFVPPSTGVHLDVADGLRGLAILLVVCSHGFYFNREGSKALGYFGSLIGTGWVGVPIFFVLSGFLLSLPFFTRRQANPEFWYVPGYATRRILKIIPPFYLATVALALFYYWHYRDPAYFQIGAAWAMGIAHFVYVPKYFNTSFWSLWVEIGFYAVLPLMFLASRRVSNRTAGWLMFGLLMSVPFISRLVTWPVGVSEGELAFTMRRFPSFLSNFGWGVLFGSYYVSVRNNANGNKWGWLGYAGLGLLTISCIGFGVTNYHGAPGKVSSQLEIELQQLLPGLSAFLMLFFVFIPGSTGARFFSSSAMRFFGIVSYEWFLLHQPAQFQFREWLVSSHGNFGRYLFTVVTPSLVTLALAAFIYRSFSLPILRWGREKVSSDPLKPTVSTGISSCRT